MVAVSVVLGAEKEKALQPALFGVILLTVTPHAHGQALLQPAILTSIAVVLVYITLLIQATLVALVFAHGPFEEAFAPLTADHAIVPARGSVSTHNTDITTKQVW